MSGLSVVSICGRKGIGKSYIGNVIVNRFMGKGVSDLGSNRGSSK
jgi:polynucleotide 5'-kinase involved in rRNA processing